MSRRTPNTGRLTIGGLLLFLVVFPLVSDLRALPASHLPQIEIQAPDVSGSLPMGSSLTFLLHVSNGHPTRPEDLVAIVEGPSLPTRLYPLVSGEKSRELSAVVEVRTPPPGMTSVPPKAIPVYVIIARRRGMELEQMRKHTIYVTLRAPAVSSMPAPGPPSGSASAGTQREPAGLRTAPAFQAAPAEEAVREEDLLRSSRLNGSYVYWKHVNDLISRSLRQHISAQPPSRVKRNPEVRFRLFASGEAQLIQLERSSGDDQIDEAAMLAVIDAHPFPPFPADTSDPYLDVHVMLPMSAP